MAVKSIPDGYHSVAPYLSIAGAAKAIDFYKRAFGAAELYYLGAMLFRRGLERALDTFAKRDDWPPEERHRITESIAWRNARRAYRLDDARYFEASPGGSS